MITVKFPLQANTLSLFSLGFDPMKNAYWESGQRKNKFCRGTGKAKAGNLSKLNE
jgi:hypothetical protein